MFRSGYQGASVRDICAAACAPQGSFTNHFRSKEAFAREVLDRFGDFSLEATSQSKLLRRRLQAIFQEWRAPFAACIAEAQTIGEIDSTFDPRAAFCKEAPDNAA
jgi:TetR/AcrR family transcriptional regulator, transcriptional repressor for nem operon